MSFDHGWEYKTGKDLSDWLVKGGATGAGWDSISHTSFQLGGAFSEKTMKNNGVATINARPILHMSVGGSQPDALIDVTGDRRLRSFYRARIDKVRSLNKSPLIQNIAPSINMFRKKPMLRASKHQIMEDLLTGFEA